MPLKKERPRLLAWMKPDGTRRQQILSVCLVPDQKGVPISLYSRIMDQQSGKIYRLLKKSQEEYQEGRQDLEVLLSGLGLLPPDVEDLSDRDFVMQIMDEGQELRTWIGSAIRPSGKDPMEIPGARELYDSLTLEEWMKALDDEVTGRMEDEECRDTVDSINHPSIKNKAEKQGEKQDSKPEPATELSKSDKEKTDQFAGNKIFTSDAVAAARARLKAKLNTLRSGFDPELFYLGVQASLYHVEAGTRKFSDYANIMLEEFGEVFRPYLKIWYNAARDWPGVDSTGMQSYDEVQAIPTGKEEFFLDNEESAADDLTSANLSNTEEHCECRQ
ncbi:MAG: hypothetical protein ACWGKN_09435 [Desulfoprunum sp.]